MAKLKLSKLRNIGIIAHIDAGKTTLTERILFYTKSTHRMGEVDKGTTVTDYQPEEQARGITITAAGVSCQWKDVVLNIIDTPGHVDFTAEVERSLRVLDGGVVVFSAVEGVEAQSETVWRQADHYHVPRLAFINKMDRTGADYFRVLDQIEQRLRANPLPLQIPIGASSNFQGVIDLVSRRAYFFETESLGATVTESDIPDELAAEVETWRDRLFDVLTQYDDEDRITTAYLEGDQIELEVIQQAVRNVCLNHRVIPVFCGSALKYVGVQLLLDAIAAYLPSPQELPPVEGTNPRKPGRTERRKPDPSEPFCALLFKVQADKHGDLAYLRIYSGTLKAGTRVYNPRSDAKENLAILWRVRAGDRERIDVAQAGEIVGVVGLKNSATGDTLCDTKHPILLEKIEFPETVVSISIEPQSSDEKKKLLETLTALDREDPTFDWRADEETGQTIMSGMGELHLEVLCNRIRSEFGLQPRIGKPRVSYRETIKGPARAWGVFDHPAGAQPLFAQVEVEVRPSRDSQQAVVRNKMKPGAIPPQFVPAIESALIDEARSGGLLGYPLIDLELTLHDAVFRAGESTEAAFRAAASDAFRKAIRKAGIVLLEPIMRLEVTVPEEYLGDVLSDLNARRAEILDTKLREQLGIIEARVPLERVFGYATAVRSLSQGRASYSLEPHAYAPADDSKFRELLD